MSTPNVEAPGTEVKLSDGETYIVDFHGPKVPAGTQCRFIADKILNKDAHCSQPPCSFNGVHQPSLVRTFEESSDLYVFSYFYDRTHPSVSHFPLRWVSYLNYPVPFATAERSGRVYSAASMAPFPNFKTIQTSVSISRSKSRYYIPVTISHYTGN